MKPAFTFVLTSVGLVLLAMDRILDKSMVVTFDQRLLAIVQKFPLLKLKDFNSAVTVLMIVVMVYLVYFDDYFPPEIRFPMKFGVLLTAVLGLLTAVIVGALAAKEVLRREKNRDISFVISSSLLAPFFIGYLFLVSSLKFILLPLIYPLKGIYILNNKCFNSFSGLLGLILAIIGTALQIF
jgi:hypothetical protein